MNRLPQNQRRRRLGAHVIEFALTLPAFLALVAALFDFGWLFYQQAMLDTAIHEGCRAGAVVDPDEEVPEDVARDAILSRLESFGQPCPSTEEGVATSEGDLESDGEGGYSLGSGQQCAILFERRGERPAISMECEVVKRYTPLFGLVPSPETVGAQTIMRFEWQDAIDEPGGS